MTKLSGDCEALGRTLDVLCNLFAYNSPESLTKVESEPKGA